MLSVAIAFICIVQNKSMLAFYKLLIHIYSHSKHLYVHNKMIHFSYKGGCVVCERHTVHVLICLKEMLVWATDKWPWAVMYLKLLYH